MDLGFKTNCSIVWVITGRRGVSSERRRSSCSSLYRLFIPHLTLLDHLLTDDHTSTRIFFSRKSSFQGSWVIWKPLTKIYIYKYVKLTCAVPNVYGHELPFVTDEGCSLEILQIFALGLSSWRNIVITSICPFVCPSVCLSVGKLYLLRVKTRHRFGWNHQICTKHASWDTLGCYGKWGSLTLNFKVILAILTHNSRKFGLSVW